MKLKCEIVKVEERKTQDGRKFTVYKTTDKNGKLLDVRFTQASGFKTDKRGTVTGEGNIDRTRRYPCVWFKTVDSFEPWTAPEEDDGKIYDVSEIF